MIDQSRQFPVHQVTTLAIRPVHDGSHHQCIHSAEFIKFHIRLLKGNGAPRNCGTPSPSRHGPLTEIYSNLLIVSLT